MNSKIFSTILLGFSLSLIPAAMAQETQPTSLYPDASTQEYYRRRKEKTQGQESLFEGSAKLQVRADAHRFARIEGNWETYIRADLDSDAQVNRIGFIRLDNARGYDVINVGDPGNCVKKIRIHVLDADANIDRITLRYADGSNQELELNGYYAAGGGDPSWREVPNSSTCVDSIVIIGQTEQSRDSGLSARIEVWGLK